MVYYHEAMLARQGRRFRDLARTTAHFVSIFDVPNRSPFRPRRGRHHGVEGDATRFFAAATASSPPRWAGIVVAWPLLVARVAMGSVAAESISEADTVTRASPSRGVHSIHSNTGRPSAFHMARGGAGRGYPSTVMPAEVSWAGRSDAQFQRVRTLQWCARGTKGADPARGRGPNTPNRRKVERPRGGGARFNALVRPYDPPAPLPCAEAESHEPNAR